MPENYEEFILLTLRTWSSRKSSKMQEENRKHQWLPLCLARLARKTSMERPVARLMISSLNLHVSSKPVNPQECVWKKLHRNILRTISQEKGQFTTSLQFVTQIYSHASSNEDTRSKSSEKGIVDLGEPTSFLDHVYLGCTQRQCETSKDIVDNYRTMFESRIPQEQLKNYHARKICVFLRGHMTWKDMARNV